jgi:hypothetical protein
MKHDVNYKLAATYDTADKHRRYPTGVALHYASRLVFNAAAKTVLLSRLYNRADPAVTLLGQ